MGRKNYEGQEITVSFDMQRCIHSRNCFLKLPGVFDPEQRPWVQPDNAPPEEIAAIVRTCPSGALAFAYRDGRTEAAPAINRIAVLENGPLAIAGTLVTEGAAGQFRQTLCRCGQSKNKPFCDYSHVEAGFQATGEPDPKIPAETEAKGGAVSVTRTSNGSLKIEGNVEITTGTGRRIATVSKAFLCRCGQSKNKPFCDGSHKAAGFVDQVNTGS